MPDHSICARDETESLLNNSGYVATIDLPSFTIPLIEMRYSNTIRRAYVAGTNFDYDFLIGKDFSEVRVVGYLPWSLDIRNTATLKDFVRLSPLDQADVVLALPDEAKSPFLQSLYFEIGDMMYFDKQSSPGFCFWLLVRGTVICRFEAKIMRT